MKGKAGTSNSWFRDYLSSFSCSIICSEMEIITALPILIILLLTIHLLFRHKRENLPPSPIGIPVIGHLHLLKPPLHHSLQTLSSKYGPLLFLKFGYRPALVLSSPSLAEECLTKDNDIIFANRVKTMASEHFTYNNNTFVWAPYGHQWRTMRCLSVVEIFCSKSIKKYSHVREGEVRYILRSLFKDSGGGGMQKVESKFLISLLVTNSIFKVVSGRRYIDEDVADRNVEKQKFQDFKDKFYPNLTTNICDFVPILRWIGYKGIEKSMIKLQKRDEFFENLIEQIRSRRKSATFSETSKEENLSVTETFLSMQESDPEFITDEVVKSVTVMMLIAGTETSSVTLEWAMTLLLKHPEELRKVKSEIDSHVGNERLINESDLVKLPYLRHVIDETLRLCLPAPLLVPHYSSEPCKISGFSIPKETMLIVNAWAIHRDPKIWENPNDFKPERFKNLASNEKENYIFLPFGIGRRACPGASLGLHIVSLALGSLVQCFEWNKVDSLEDVAYTSGITVKRVDPLEAMCCPQKEMIKILSHI